MSIESKLAKKAVEKKTTKSKKNLGGRPSVIDETLLAKLEEWFSMWLTDVECCLYVDIDPATLYRYCEKNPEFRDRKEVLKNNLKMVAKANLNKTIKAWDSVDSKWYLERKSKDEFSLKTETENRNTNLNIEIDKDTSDEDLLKIINW